MLLNKAQQQLLLALAKESITHGLKYGQTLQINSHDYATELQTIRATFVSLAINDQLRGCIGVLEAIRPLVVDISENAFAAAFNDPRFPPLTMMELPQLAIQLSILSATEAIQFTSEADLISQLRPNIDGLILQEGQYHSTFLPSVWKSLPEPENFLQHLKQKAGLPSHYWSDSLQVSRYQCQLIA